MMLLKTFSFTLIACVATLLMALSVGAFSEDEAGKDLYEKNCLKCHGEDGTGDTKIGQLTKTPNLNEKPWKRGDTLEDLVKMITEGEGKMPKAKKLSDQEIQTVAKYTLGRFGKKD